MARSGRTMQHTAPRCFGRDVECASKDCHATKESNQCTPRLPPPQPGKEGKEGEGEMQDATIQVLPLPAPLPLCALRIIPFTWRRGALKPPLR